MVHSLSIAFDNVASLCQKVIEHSDNKKVILGMLIATIAFGIIFSLFILNLKGVVSFSPFTHLRTDLLSVLTVSFGICTGIPATFLSIGFIKLLKRRFVASKSSIVD